MTRAITLLLQVGLVLTAIAAILFAVRIILQQALGIGSWYWGGAIAVFLGPLAFTAALALLGRNTGSNASEPSNA